MLRSLRALAEGWPGPEERRYWRERCARSPLPTLLLRGRREALNPADGDMELARHAPDGQFYEHVSAGHWLCREDPAWVEGKLREVLFRIERPGTTSELPLPGGS